MYKRLLCILAVLMIAMGQTMPALATETTAQEEPVFTELKIVTVEEFLEFAERCRLNTYSHDLYVSLEKDIDLRGYDFSGIPYFDGVFEGNDHKITGVKITSSGSVQGLFRRMTAAAVVQNLHVNGEIHPGGSQNSCGAIAGINEGQIRNCHFSGSVSGGSYVGGLVGTNAVTGIVENSRMEGDVSGSHFVGGIAGGNYGVIRACVNDGMINTTPVQNRVELSDITMDTIANTESAGTVTDIGGIAGISSGVIRDCHNSGDVGYQHMGYNIGGIAGTQSGYITGCENSGNIRGRKEVGGIVGQMEPAAQIEFSEDTLQILQKQLAAVSGLVSNASGNAQANASQVNGQIQILKDQAKTARDAVDTIIPDIEDPTLPDLDTILAAQNTLSDSIGGMPETFRGIASATQNTVTSLTRDLNAISAQLGAVGETVSNASDHLGGTVTDVSDQDTQEMCTGKVENCGNYGAVLGDLNVGGIAGAMAMENDLDILEDWEQLGEETLNFQSEVRAVIRNCVNGENVTGGKQNVGGIVGWQPMGLVKDCGNTATVDGTGADYVGGIVGMSSGYLRDAYAKCEVLGNTYVGGIAGSGRVISDSLAQVKFAGTGEKHGAIVGEADAFGTEQQIEGNRYLCVGDDVGAIDGVSYAGQAEAVALDVFMDLPDLPECFRMVTVRFLHAEGELLVINLEPGTSLDMGAVPAVPEKAGHTGVWSGLAEADLTDILFDVTFEAVYTPYSTTVQSEEVRSNGLPIALMEGAFSKESGVQLLKSCAAPVLGERETLVESWTVTTGQPGSSLRFLPPEGTDTEKIKLYVCNADGVWRESEFTVTGKYLALSWESNDTQLVLAQVQSAVFLWWIAGAAAAVFLTVVIVILCVKTARKKKNAETVTEA